MKQVILKVPETLPVICVAQLVNPRAYVYIAVTGERKSLSILVQEDSKYIFRNTDNSRFGHSGAWPTIQRTIQEALSVNKTEIFEFDNFDEAAKFIVQKKS